MQPIPIKLADLAKVTGGYTNSTQLKEHVLAGKPIIPPNQPSNR